MRRTVSHTDTAAHAVRIAGRRSAAGGNKSSDSKTLAFGAAGTVALFKEGSAEPASNRTAILEFQVEDVEAEFARLKDDVEVVCEPKMMPWGNRAAQFRDPEGTLVLMYTPVTEAAKKRFGGR